MSYETAIEYVNTIGAENITEAHLQEWQDKLEGEFDTLKKRFIWDHITVISNALYSKQS
jgi:hypothetical protein